MGPHHRVRDRQRGRRDLVGQLLQYFPRGFRPAPARVAHDRLHHGQGPDAAGRGRGAARLRVPIVFNILAFAIVAAITVVLVWGIRESANFNFWMVAIKLVVLGFFVLGELQVRQAGPLDALRPERFLRHCGGRGDRLLRLHRLRRRLDGGRGVQEPQARHADRHHRLPRSSAPSSTSSSRRSSPE